MLSEAAMQVSWEEHEREDMWDYVSFFGLADEQSCKHRSGEDQALQDSDSVQSFNLNVEPSIILYIYIYIVNYEVINHNLPLGKSSMD
jgi:hypothetical protein